jgi:hypothetical protein
MPEPPSSKEASPDPDVSDDVFTNGLLCVNTGENVNVPEAVAPGSFVCARVIR